MSSKKKVLDIARAEIGYVEGRGGFSKYGDWYKSPEFSKAAWCASFVSWVFHKAGMPLPPIQNEKGFAYCPYGVSYYRKQHSFYRSPQVGDIVFFDWGGDKVADHVGIVEEVFPTYCKTIEGNTAIRNQSNGGQVMRRTRYYPSILGFARPQYKKIEDYSWSGFYLENKYPMMQGIEIKILQTWLNTQGYDLTVDGAYGAITEKAVAHFQANNFLVTDGVVGQETWSKLRELVEKR